MLERIRSFFGERIDPEREGDPDARLRLAAAALMVEVMRADFDAAEAEKAEVLAAVRRQLGLTEQETAVLVALAEEETEGTVCLYEFTRLIHESFDAERKGRLLEELWRVAFADRVLEAQEEFLIRKIAGLLHVPHADFIAAKRRARNDARRVSG